MVDRSNSKVVFDSIMPPTDDKKDEVSEVDNCTNLHQLKLNDSSKYSQIHDVSIKVKLNGFERSFNCHKSILVAASPYFEAMFCGGFKEEHSGEITINEVDPNVFSDLLEYIYTKEIKIDEENIEKLMIAESIFQINGLEKLCSNFLENKIKISNCFEFPTFAKNYGILELSTKIETFIGKNFIEISKSEEFKLQPDSVISKIISKDELHVICESQVFNALLDWIKYDLPSRKHYLNKLIRNVRCHLIKPNFISMKLEKCQVIKDTCYEYLNKVLDDLKAYIPIESKPRQLDIPQVMYVINRSFRSDKSLESVQFRLSETDVWFKLPKLCLRIVARSVVINGFIYMLRDNGDMERYNPISNEWKKCKSLNDKLCMPNMEVIDNELYTLESFHNNFYEDFDADADESIYFKITRMMKYDPITDKWRQKPSLDRGRDYFGCAVFNRMLYVVGGGHNYSSVNRVDKYDPQRDEWSSVKSMLTPRSDPAVVTLGNYIYAIGGWNEKEHLKTVERYDVLNDNWVFVASMKYARGFPKAIVFNKKIYVFGGFSEAGRDYLKTVDCYNDVTNEWKNVARTNERIRELIVSYQPCVPDICVNFPFYK